MRINYDSLLAAGFQPCIFAPIYCSQWSYYLGNLNWNLTKKEEVIYPKWWRFWEKPTIRRYNLMNDLNWDDATMIIAISADGESYIDYRTHKRFSTIEEIKEYCKEKGIEMWASKKKSA